MDQSPSFSALTLFTRDLPRALAFYRALGFELRAGGPADGFATFEAGAGCLNLLADPAFEPAGRWGRVIFHVDDVDAVFARALREGLAPEDVPRDAPWGERFFHLRDPDGHEISIARPIDGRR